MDWGIVGRNRDKLILMEGVLDIVFIQTMAFNHKVVKLEEFYYSYCFNLFKYMFIYLIGSVVRHNQEIQDNQAHHGSNNYKGAGAPFSQKDNRAHQGSDNIKKTSPTLKWVKYE